LGLLFLKEELDSPSKNPEVSVLSIENIKALYSQLKTSIITYNSISELYESHPDLSPLIVVRKKWDLHEHNDYCFVVDNIHHKFDGLWADGTTYSFGVFERNTSYHADVDEFRVYTGSYCDQLIEQYTDVC